MPKVELIEIFRNGCRKNEITAKSDKAFNAKVSKVFGISPTIQRIKHNQQNADLV